MCILKLHVLNGLSTNNLTTCDKYCYKISVCYVFIVYSNKVIVDTLSTNKMYFIFIL